MKRQREISRKDWKRTATGMYSYHDGCVTHLMDKMPKGWDFHRQMGNHSRLHPRIKLDMRRLTMTVKVKYPYEIDLETMVSPAEVLDWYCQIMNKTWADDAIGGEFFHALEDACHRHFGENSQGVFCPCGDNMCVNWKKRSYTKAV